MTPEVKPQVSWAGPFAFSRSDLSTDGDLYMRRWVLTLPTGRQARLHWIVRPDAGHCLHDHPFDFWSLVLRGWYVEQFDDSAYAPSEIDAVFTRKHCWLSLRRFPAEHLHQISEVSPGGCWTLVFTGPIRRLWGFQTARGWVDFRTYLRGHTP